MVFLALDVIQLKICFTFIIRIRAQHVICELAGPLEHFAFIIGAIREFHLREHFFDFILGVADADESSVGHAFHAMAGGAYLLVHLVPSPDRSCIEGVENTLVTPRIVLF